MKFLSIEDCLTCHSMVSAIQCSLSLGACSGAPLKVSASAATRYHRLRPDLRHREVRKVNRAQVRGEPLVQGTARIPLGLPTLLILYLLLQENGILEKLLNIVQMRCCPVHGFNGPAITNIIIAENHNKKTYSNPYSAS